MPPSDSSSGPPSSKVSKLRENPKPGDVKPQPAHKQRFLYTVYLCYDEADELLYVGESANFLRRLREHEVGRGKKGPKSWYREVAYVETVHLPPGTTEWETKACERTLIHNGGAGTKYNEVHNPRRQEAWQNGQLADVRAERERDDAEESFAGHDGITREIPVPANRRRPRLVNPANRETSPAAPGREVTQSFLVPLFILGVLLGLIILVFIELFR